MIKEAIILAGGFGTRLKEVIGEDIPKPMAPVDGRPFLEYLFKYLDKWGVERLILATGHKHEVIEAHFGDRFNKQEIVYSREEEPLGTGGAVKKAMEYVNGYSGYIINGDTYFDVNLWKLANSFRAKEAESVMALRKMADVSRYGSVKIDLDNRITEFTEKGSQTGMGFINGGTYILERKAFLDLDLPDIFSLEKDYFEQHYNKLRIFGVRCYSYFLDIGIPEDYEEAQDAFDGLFN
ncbi:MAG: D-glycero-D-manno-heptose 1-phosphate guanosyltransferase [Bacteroidetes bacterium]|nr:MAG: D-glycero-D-manno-heptose 1-phosphate guanosyltransferase [Bacteroidota bacterium]RLD81466.1 MAG: D-glycero-D-manno-heptose 1-phosphate guanosyltransferase [Bacteroidota bacterium]